MPTLPYNTDELVKQTQAMLAQTKEQGTTPFKGSSYDTITAKSLEPQNILTPVLPKITPIPEISSLQPTIDLINRQYDMPLPNENAIKQERTNVQDLISKLYGSAGETSKKAQMEADPALQIKRQQVQDLSSQLNAIIAEQKTIPLQIQEMAKGQGVTAGGMAPIEVAQLRQNAIKALGISSLLFASQGNLTLALDQVDRAIKAEFEPLKSELEARRANLEMLMNDPAITREEQRRADILRAQLDWQQKQQEKIESDRKSVLELAAKLGGYGVDNFILTKIQEAPSFDEAMSIAAPHMQNPEAKQALENARLENVLTKEKIRKEQYELSLLKRYDGLSPSEYGKILKEEQKAINEASSVAEQNQLKSDALITKIVIMDDVLKNPAINSVVGPTPFTRATTGLGTLVNTLTIGGFDKFSSVRNYFSGDADKLVGQTEQFISKEFLQSLIDVKAQGATFGALQKAEQDALTAAASFIGGRRIYKGKGDEKVVVGYDISEKDFIEEMTKIRGITQKVYERAVGKSFKPDEVGVLDDVFPDDNTIIDTDYNSYF